MPDLIVERMKAIRKRKGLSMRKLACDAGVPQASLSELEAGHRVGGRMTVETAKRLAVVLGVTLDYLCGMHEGETP